MTAGVCRPGSLKKEDSPVQTLLRLLRYNAWGNERVFALCEAAAPTLLDQADRGSIGSTAETLKHLVGVEDAYLAMTQGRDLDEALGSREAYAAHDLAWFARRSAGIAEGYLALLSAHDNNWLDEAMQVPWFDFSMTIRDGLLQAITHSAQHRAQILSVLGTQGVAVPDLDYVLMVGEHHRRAPV